MKMSDESVLSKLSWIIVGTVVTGAIGLGYYFLQTNFLQQTPELVFSSLNSIPFSGEESNLGIYHVEILNDGKLTIKEIICVIIIDSAIIEEYKISVEPSIKYTGEKVGDRFTLELPMLNSKEKIGVSLLTTSIDELPPKPEVSLRGEGVVGSESTLESQSPQSLIFGNYSVMVSIGSSMLALIMGYYFRTKV